MRILFVGDIVGQAGRQMLARHRDRLVDRHQVDLVIVNGENAAGGFGLTVDVTLELLSCGVDVITTGNHVWDKRDILDYIDRQPALLRPANYPAGLPGRGAGIFETPSGIRVGVLNLEGRVFMSALDCPFRTADHHVDLLRRETAIILVDMHAEATSEKMALGWYLDGRVSAIVGTHTHVPTADERVLPGGTAFITDVGMTGSSDSVIGMTKEPVIQKFLTHLPTRFEAGRKDPMLSAVLFEIDEHSGKARSVERIVVRD